MDRIELLNWLKYRLSPEKYSHSLGAEQAAIKLAERFSFNPEKAAFAALIHDNAKDISYEESIEIITENNFYIEEDIKNNHKIIHAYLGAYIAEKELGIKDREIFDSIMFHTTGRVGMGMLEKIVFLADKIEENTREKDFREHIIDSLNKNNSLDEAILTCIGLTIKSLVDRKLVIHKQTIDIWNDMVGSNK